MTENSSAHSSGQHITLTSPCYARQTLEGEHSLRQMALKGKLNIRGNAEDPAFVAGIKQALNVDLPVVANTLTEKNSKRLFWLGPDEWLLHCDADEAEELLHELHTALKDVHHSVTEVSDYYTVLRLRGPRAEELIRKGCPLDIHSSVFRSGDMAQTRFGHASILLHKLGDGESWDMQVRWSYAEYVWDYIVSGMAAL